jgi:hypothetical protein
MFFAGVVLSHAVFFFDRKKKKEKFYLMMSAIILQILDNAYLAQEASIEFVNDQIKFLEDSEREEYLQKERKKLATFMELYVLLFTKAVPEEGRRYINYKSWMEAKALIDKLRGFMKDEQNKR